MQISIELIRENLEISTNQFLRTYVVGLPWRNKMLSASLKERSRINISVTEGVNIWIYTEYNGSHYFKRSKKNLK